MSNCVSLKKIKLILRKIVKLVATRCQILRLKCTKIDLGWGSAQTQLGSLKCFPDP